MCVWVRDTVVCVGEGYSSVCVWVSDCVLLHCLQHLHAGPGVEEEHAP